MWKKLLILSLCIAVLFIFSAPISSVNAGGKWKKSKNINWRIAGTIVQNIDVTSIVTGSTDPHSLINLSAKGSPGPAKITLLSRTTDYGGTIQCEDGYFPIADFEQNDFIAIFPDQSLLFASIAEEGGILCIDDYMAPTTTYFIVYMSIKGGKKRFEGAGGSFTAEGYGYPGFSTEGTLVGENGRIKGMIEFD